MQFIHFLYFRIRSKWENSTCYSLVFLNAFVVGTSRYSKVMYVFVIHFKWVPLFQQLIEKISSLYWLLTEYCRHTICWSCTKRKKKKKKTFPHVDSIIFQCEKRSETVLNFSFSYDCWLYWSERAHLAGDWESAFDEQWTKSLAVINNNYSFEMNAQNVWVRLRGRRREREWDEVNIITRSIHFDWNQFISLDKYLSNPSFASDCRLVDGWFRVASTPNGAKRIWNIYRMLP